MSYGFDDEFDEEWEYCGLYEDNPIFNEEDEEVQDPIALAYMAGVDDEI
jgi:hypothetical protein